MSLLDISLLWPPQVQQRVLGLRFSSEMLTLKTSSALLPSTPFWISRVFERLGSPLLVPSLTSLLFCCCLLDMEEVRLVRQQQTYPLTSLYKPHSRCSHSLCPPCRVCALFLVGPSPRSSLGLPSLSPHASAFPPACSSAAWWLGCGSGCLQLANIECLETSVCLVQSH